MGDTGTTSSTDTCLPAVPEAGPAADKTRVPRRITEQASTGVRNVACACGELPIGTRIGCQSHAPTGLYGMHTHAGTHSSSLPPSARESAPVLRLAVHLL